MGRLHACGSKRPRRAAAEDGLTRKLLQRAGDERNAPSWNGTHGGFEMQPARC